jgi:hypothetical protein
MKTVSLELAKQLKKAGYPQEGERFWGEDHEGARLFSHNTYKDYSAATYSGKKKLFYKTLDNGNDIYEDFIVGVSPTADEILEQLPDDIYDKKEDGWFTLTIHKVTDREDHYEGWEVLYKEVNGNLVFCIEKEVSLSDVAAKMWLYLKENNLLPKKFPSGKQGER